MRTPSVILALLLGAALLQRQPAESEAQPTLPCDEQLTPESFYRAYLRAHLQVIGRSSSELLALAQYPEPDNPVWQTRMRQVLTRWQYPYLYVPDPPPPAYADFAVAYGRMADAMDAAARAYLQYLDEPTVEHLDTVVPLLQAAVMQMQDFRPYAALLQSCPESGGSTERQGDELGDLPRPVLLIVVRPRGTV